MEDSCLIEKKACAVIVHTELTKVSNILIFTIGAIMVTACFSVFSKWAGAICGGVFSWGFGFLLMKYKEKMKYYEDKYNIEKPKPMLNIK